MVRVASFAGRVCEPRANLAAAAIAIFRSTLQTRRLWERGAGFGRPSRMTNNPDGEWKARVFCSGADRGYSCGGQSAFLNTAEAMSKARLPARMIRP